MQALAAALVLANVLRFSAPTLAKVTGFVASAEGKPLRNAQVYVYEAMPRGGTSAVCSSCYRECGKHEQVGATGYFAIGLLDPNLRVRLLAVAEGYEPALSEFIEPDSNVRLNLSPRALADQRHVVRGRVLDSDAKVVIGAIVEPAGVHWGSSLGFGNFPGLDRLSITDPKGEFALRIPADSEALDVRVRSRAYAPKIARGLIPGATRTVTVGAGATVVGRLMYQGEPVPGKRVGFVQCSRDTENFLGVQEIASDGNGIFTMTSLGPGEEYVLFVSSDSPLTAPATVATVGGDDTNLDVGNLELAPGFRIAGRVISSGRLDPHTKVTLNRVQAWETRVVEVGADGKFEFEGVPPERVTLSVAGASIALAISRDMNDLQIPAE